MKICVAVAAHKPYWMPDDKAYLPLQVGAALHPDVNLGFAVDNAGENISDKNKTFCELTGLYWLWKQSYAEWKDVDCFGLCHYRRYFAKKGFWAEKKARILTWAELEKALAKAPVLLPSPRNYFIETNYSQYVHAHHEQDLTVTKEILSEKYPEYLPAWESRMAKTIGHRFNMFVMQREMFQSYCEWLFDVLFELEKRLDITGYDPYAARVFGFVGERLLDIWVETNGVAYTEAPAVNLENQHWLKKGAAFLKRKFKGKKA